MLTQLFVAHNVITVKQIVLQPSDEYDEKAQWVASRTWRMKWRPPTMRAAPTSYTGWAHLPPSTYLFDTLVTGIGRGTGVVTCILPELRLFRSDKYTRPTTCWQDTFKTLPKAQRTRALKIWYDPPPKNNNARVLTISRALIAWSGLVCKKIPSWNCKALLLNIQWK